MVHRCEHMCAFKVPSEHSSMRLIILCTVHLYIWRYMLFEPHVRGSVAVRVAVRVTVMVFAVYGHVWYTCVSIYILLKC